MADQLLTDIKLTNLKKCISCHCTLQKQGLVAIFAFPHVTVTGASVASTSQIDASDILLPNAENEQIWHWGIQASSKLLSLRGSNGMDTLTHTDIQHNAITGALIFRPVCECQHTKKKALYTPIHSIIPLNDFETCQRNIKMFQHFVYKTPVITNFHIKEHKEMWRKHSPVRFSHPSLSVDYYTTHWPPHDKAVT